MITKIESGKVDISQKKIVAFAKALGTTPGYLMGWTDVPYMDLQYFSEEKPPDAPVTHEARILSRGIDKLPKEQREQALAVVRAMFSMHEDYFKDEGDQSDDT